MVEPGRPQIQCKHFACQITMERIHTHTHRILHFHSNSGYPNVPQYYTYMYIACLVLVKYYRGTQGN